MDGNTDIHPLDEDTVARIAAGEVVERPASAVKELVENSLDADAARIDVTVEEGGTESIRVADDGRGMTEPDLRAAVRQHTTSKIGDLTDLESGVATLGFRGEALHTIGSVSRLRIRSRPRADTLEERGSADDVPSGAGTELVYEGGEVTSVEPTGCPEGTTVEVSDLFYNTPARRKFLKTTATEFAHVNRVVTRYALANPDVAITLTHDGREVFATTGQGDLQAAVMAVYGREVAASMIPVDVAADELPPGPIESVSGLVSHPETNRSTREYLATYVNGRAVTADAVREGIMDAYGTQLGTDRYPFVVCFLDVPGDAVDVNVHPRKLRVRYNKPEAVRRQVRAAVEDALREEGILRSSAPRGRSAPDQTTIEPSSTGEELDASSTDPTPGKSTTVDTAEKPSRDSPPARSTSPTTSSGSSSRSPTSESTPSGTPRSRSTTTREPDTQTTLHGDDATPTTEYDNFPDLRVLGQLHDTYIVAEADDGLILIDQHAADERINYERLQARFEGDTTTQALADPVDVELTAGEAAVFDTYKDALARLGFYADRIDDRTVQVTTVPAFVAEATGPELIRGLLGDLVADEQTAEETVEAVADSLVADMACYPSIKGNTSLTEGSVVDVLSALDDCENPWACPHGRPVLIHFDSDEIDGRFERDYPGGH